MIHTRGGRRKGVTNGVDCPHVRTHMESPEEGTAASTEENNETKVIQHDLETHPLTHKHTYTVHTLGILIPNIFQRWY